MDGPAPVNRDHCPPKGFFAPEDRQNFPILLPTHEICNSSWKVADELIGIIADALHIRKRSMDALHTGKLHAEIVSLGKRPATAISNLPIAPMAARIVRGMHALLYKEFLPVSTASRFHIPLPEADTETKRIREPLEQSFTFSGVIRKALISHTADVVRAYNGKFKYACTWERFANGTPFCITCFDIYSFHTLSPPVSNFPKSFIGMYIPDSQPKGTIQASGLEIELTQEELLDPWLQT